jgi:hypothetical protein
MNTGGSVIGRASNYSVFTLEADSESGHGAEKAGQVWCPDKRLAAVIHLHLLLHDDRLRRAVADLVVNQQTAGYAPQEHLLFAPRSRIQLLLSCDRLRTSLLLG